MIRSLDINLDSKCTAKCKHCCFSCEPESSMHLQDKEIDEILRFLELEHNITHVSITGGEPLLRYKKVNEIIRKCHSLNKTVSIVTNGFWADQFDKALKVAEELKNNGLDVITISYDNYHRAYIPVKNIKNALRAIKEANIRAALNLTVGKNEDGFNLIKDLGDAVFGIQLGVMPICRAGKANDLDEEIFYLIKESKISKRCPAMNWEMVIHHDGFVYPCCSPSVFETGLRIGNIRQHSLPDIKHRIETNLLLYVLREEGLEWFIKRLNLNFKGSYVNTCELCKEVFSDSEKIKRLTPSLLDYYEDKLLQIRRQE